MEVGVLSLFSMVGVFELSEIEPYKAIYKFHPSKTNEFIYGANGGSCRYIKNGNDRSSHEAILLLPVSSVSHMRVAKIRH
jgi:hypothetical protein